MYSFGLSSPPGHKMFNQSRIKLFKKVYNSTLSHIAFYLEDDDHKFVDFNGESIRFTCQLIKKFEKWTNLILIQPKIETEDLL